MFLDGDPSADSGTIFDVILVGVSSQEGEFALEYFLERVQWEEVKWAVADHTGASFPSLSEFRAFEVPNIPFEISCDASLEELCRQTKTILNFLPPSLSRDLIQGFYQLSLTVSCFNNTSLCKFRDKCSRKQYRPRMD